MTRAAHTTLVQLLTQHREAKGLTSAALAKRASLYGKISRSHLARIESGERIPSREKLLILARALELSAKETDRLLKSAGHVPVGDGTQTIPALENPAVAALLELLGDAKISARKKLAAQEGLVSYIKWLRTELMKSSDK